MVYVGVVGSGIEVLVCIVNSLYCGLAGLHRSYIGRHDARQDPRRRNISEGITAPDRYTCLHVPLKAVRKLLSYLPQISNLYQTLKAVNNISQQGISILRTKKTA